MKAPESLLSVRDLNISLGGQHLVRSVDLDIEAGQCLALVGESGSGKSLTALSLMRLLPRSAKISQQHILFEGQSLAAYSETQWRQLRARRIAMIFQNPMTAMNPTMRVGQQIAEVLCLHAGVSRREAFQQFSEHPSEIRRNAPAAKVELSGGWRGDLPGHDRHGAAGNPDGSDLAASAIDAQPNIRGAAHLDALYQR